MDTWHPLLSISSLEIWEQKPSYDHAIQSGANRLSSSMSSSELRTLSATSASGNSQSGSKEAVTAFKS